MTSGGWDRINFRTGRFDSHREWRKPASLQGHA